MKSVDRFQIQKDLAAITEAMEGEPVASSSDDVLDFIGRVSTAMGAIKQIHRAGADRDALLDQALSIQEAVAAFASSLQTDETPATDEG